MFKRLFLVVEYCRLYFRKSWQAWRPLVSSYLHVVRWWWPSFLPPANHQVLRVLVASEGGWAVDQRKTALLQCEWALAEADVKLELGPCIVVWRSYGQLFATYFQQETVFPPLRARPRGASLWGGPRGDNYRGKAYETPKWLLENPPPLGNLE